LGLGLSEGIKQDLLPFLLGVGLLIAYLVFSAMTEMGTHWPKKKWWNIWANREVAAKSPVGYWWLLDLLVAL